MTDRLTEQALDYLSERPATEGERLLVAEVREHRATIERVRAMCDAGMCSPEERAADLAAAGQHWALMNVRKALDTDQ